MSVAPGAFASALTNRDPGTITYQFCATPAKFEKLAISPFWVSAPATMIKTFEIEGSAA